jgi:RNA polymerase sigma-70 factor (ECF subfamily)
MQEKKAAASRDGAGLLGEFLGCKAALSRLLARIVKPHDIDDILQETFIRAYAASEKSEIRHPRAFMLKTAQNLALNHVTAAYYKRTQIEDFSTSDVHISTESVEAEFESRERFLDFCRAVRRLPAQCRRVFVLRKVYGLSQQEIAKYLAISESTVEKHVAKGLSMCRESMRRMDIARDGASEAAACRKNGSKHG